MATAPVSPARGRHTRRDRYLYWSGIVVGIGALVAVVPMLWVLAIGF